MSDSSVTCMSHDTDKLIRQLSLVAFLMAERRPLTARDIKGNVEGYQEMSDEAFARRFYSDRAELVALGRAARLAARRIHGRGALHPPLRALLPARRSSSTTTSSRRSRRACTCSRGASPTPSRYGSRSRTSRWAGLGRSARRRARPRTPSASRSRDPDYTPELQGRLGKLEARDLQAAHGPRFDYWSIAKRRRARADDQPLRAAARERHLVRDRRTTRTTRS